MPFYGKILGFSQTSEDDFAVVFDLAGTILRISTVKDHQPNLSLTQFQAGFAG